MHIIAIFPLGNRPFACSLCHKTYGRRDYLQRHLKSHNASYAVTLAGGGDEASAASTVSSATAQQIIKKVQQAAANPGGGNIVLQLQEGPSE